VVSKNKLAIPKRRVPSKVSVCHALPLPLPTHHSNQSNHNNQNNNNYNHVMAKKAAPTTKQTRLPLDKHEPVPIPPTKSLLEQAQFPFHAIIGLDLAKLGLLASTLNPSSTQGICIQGGHGAGKTILSRSISKILDKPIVEVPQNADENALLGCIDMEASLKMGMNVVQQGILQRANGAVLYIDDADLLDPSLLFILIQVLEQGKIQLEREGMSSIMPCVPALVIFSLSAEFEMNESMMHIMDALGIHLYLDDRKLTPMQRTEVVQNVEEFQLDPHTFVSKFEAQVKALGQTIQVARTKQVSIDPKYLDWIVKRCNDLGIVGNRAELYSVETAKSIAALRSVLVDHNIKEYATVEVTEKDLKYADALVLQPRATRIPPEVFAETESSPSESQAGDEELQRDEDHDENLDTETLEMLAAAILSNELVDFEQEEQGFMFPVEEVMIDPKLLMTRAVSKPRVSTTSSGKAKKTFSHVRGRYVKADFRARTLHPKLALDATIRAAVPSQFFRRNHIEAWSPRLYHKVLETQQRQEQERKAITGEDISLSTSLVIPSAGFLNRKLIIDKSDFRYKRFSRKVGALILLIVDASGSMAENRMSAAKGAAINIAANAYKSRNMVSLIAFQGKRADVLVPPSRSTAMVKHRLECLVSGGGSPLSLALKEAVRLAVNTKKRSKDIQSVHAVIISDGRANIAENNPDDHAATRSEIKEELMTAARQCERFKNFISWLCIDTEQKHMGRGFMRELAANLNATYYSLPNLKGLHKNLDRMIHDLKM